MNYRIVATLGITTALCTFSIYYTSLLSTQSADRSATIPRTNVAQETHFYIVIPTYNNERWCTRNLDALREQEYTNWSAIILNDCSTDATSFIIKNYIIEHGLSDRITLIDNHIRCGACRNIYDAIHGSDGSDCHTIPPCPDNYVVVLYDGDDWFYSPQALTRVAHAYEDTAVWMTYGQYAVYPGYRRGHCTPYPDTIIQSRSFRTFRPGAWLASHLRTFRAGLFKRIRKEDLMLQGRFLPVTWDVAMMSSMLELATPLENSIANSHVRFIPDILYVYNTETPLNDYKQHFELQQRLDRYLRAQSIYAPLEEPTW